MKPIQDYAAILSDHLIIIQKGIDKVEQIKRCAARFIFNDYVAIFFFNEMLIGLH